MTVHETVGSDRELRSRIRALFSRVPPREGWRSPNWPLLAKQRYRGKERWVAGYSHCRNYAHHFSGRVYDRILGYGDTKEAAVAMMAIKLGADGRTDA